MLVIVRVLEAALFAAYFIAQSVSDVKTMRVSTTLNDIALLTTGGAYLLLMGDAFRIETEVLLVCGAVIGLWIAGFFGSGDAKAYLAIYLGTAPYCEPGMLDTDAFFIGTLAGGVSALLYRMAAKKESPFQKGVRFAYFPFLGISCAVTLFCASLL